MTNNTKSVRLRRLGLRLKVHAAVFAACGVLLVLGLIIEPLLLPAAGSLIAYALLFRRLPFVRALERRRLRIAECPVCAYPIILVNWWRCSCSFIGSAPRHAFAPCWHCGREFTWRRGVRGSKL